MEKHPKLTICDVVSVLFSEQKRKEVFERTIKNLSFSQDNLESILRTFSLSRYDVSGAMRGIEQFKRMYTQVKIDGSAEEIKLKRDNTRKLNGIKNQLNKYKNLNYKSLVGSSRSQDGGKTWVTIDEKTVNKAVEALKKNKKLVCLQTVKDYIYNSEIN